MISVDVGTIICAGFLVCRLTTNDPSLPSAGAVQSDVRPWMLISLLSVAAGGVQVGRFLQVFSGTRGEIRRHLGLYFPLVCKLPYLMFHCVSIDRLANVVAWMFFMPAGGGQQCRYSQQDISLRNLL